MDQFRPRNDRFSGGDGEWNVDDVKRLIDRYMKGWGTWIIIALLVLLYLLSGIYVVGPGERAVVLMFGKVWTLAGPGPHYRLPRPFMSHMIVDVSKVRRAEFGYRSEGGRVRPVPPESLMLTGDENIVDVQMSVQYMVQDPVKFLFGARRPEAALRAATEVALRGVVGENTITYTMTSGRMDIQDKVKEYLQTLLDLYNTGLFVTQARLQEVDAPPEVREAFHDVVRALEDRERLIKEAEGYREDILPRARGKAKQEIRAAEAYRERRLIRSKGDVQRFDKLLTEYKKAPAITRERLFLETAEQFLPQMKKIIVGGGASRVLPLLPLGVGKTFDFPTSVEKRPRSEGSEKGN